MTSWFRPEKGLFTESKILREIITVLIRRTFTAEKQMNFNSVKANKCWAC